MSSFSFQNSSVPSPLMPSSSSMITPPSSSSNPGGLLAPPHLLHPSSLPLIHPMAMAAAVAAGPLGLMNPGMNSMSPMTSTAPVTMPTMPSSIPTTSGVDHQAPSPSEIASPASTTSGGERNSNSGSANGGSSAGPMRRRVSDKCNLPISAGKRTTKVDCAKV